MQAARSPAEMQLLGQHHKVTQVPELHANFYIKQLTKQQIRRAVFEARQLHGRLVVPEEIAAAVAYLVSDEAASVTGAVMVIDGGVTATRR
jgi:NAD(P)-dependent dehydrogenase (short-subunit alcohol dehydrogenase family)